MAYKESWTPERRKAKSERMKELWKDPSYNSNIRKKMSEGRKNFYNSEAGKLWKEELSKNNPKHNPLTVKKSSDSQKRFWSSEKGAKQKEKHSVLLSGPKTEKQKENHSKLMKQKWLNLNYVKNWHIGRNAQINKPESFLLSLLSNSWEFVGDGKFSLSGKIPDFVNKETKQIIEMFGDYWHGQSKTGISNEQHERERIQIFESEGWECLVVWEHELEDLDLLNLKLERFLCLQKDKKNN